MECKHNDVTLLQLLESCVLRLIFMTFFPGEAYMRLSKLPEAEHWYMESLRSKTDHIPAHLTYGKLLALTVSNYLPPSPFRSWFSPCRLRWIEVKVLVLSQLTQTIRR